VSPVKKKLCEYQICLVHWQNQIFTKLRKYAIGGIVR